MDTPFLLWMPSFGPARFGQTDKIALITCSKKVPRVKLFSEGCRPLFIRGSQKGWFSKRVFLADVPPERKPERGYIRMFPRAENRNEGAFACSPRTKKPERGYIRIFPRNAKTGTRAHSPKTTLLQIHPFASSRVHFTERHKEGRSGLRLKEEKVYNAALAICALTIRS